MHNLYAIIVTGMITNGSRHSVNPLSNCASFAGVSGTSSILFVELDILRDMLLITVDWINLFD